MAAKRKPRQKKTITLAEFTAWLEGVEEMQPATWTPDAAQWKLIKTKLKSIVPDEVSTPAPAPIQQPQYGGFDSQRPPAQHMGLPPGMAPPPQLPSSIPDGPVVDNSSNGPPGLPITTNEQGQKVMKTPDIDGEYKESTFS